MSEENGLIAAFVLDGKGGARELDWEGVAAWTPGDGVLWVHLSRAAEQAQNWVREHSGFDQFGAGMLLEEDSRPRVTAHDGALFVNLRGVNLNPGENPEDMVALRMCIESRRVVTSRTRKLMAVQEVRDNLAQGLGPKDAGEILVDLAAGLVERMGPIVSDLDDKVSDLEDKLIDTGLSEVRAVLGSLRRQAIALRRYLAPQRDVMARLQTERTSLLEETERYHCREIADRVTRYVEDLDAVRERAAVIQEEVQSQLSDRLNANMYLLSVVASIFLPLGFITGLFGINVGGMPGVDSDSAFTVVTVSLVVLVLIQIWVFRKKKII